MQARGLLAGEELDAMCRAVWPSLSEDVPAEWLACNQDPISPISSSKAAGSFTGKGSSGRD